MTLFRLTLIAVVLAGASPAYAAHHENPVLSKAVDAIGGRDALDNLDSFSVTGTRVRYVMNQGPEPGLGLHRYSSSKAQVTHDLKGNRFRGDFIHTGQYVGIDRPVTEIVDGHAGYITGWNDFFLQNAATNEAMDPERAAATIKTERLLNPHILLREAMADGSIASIGNDYEIGSTGAHRVTAEDIFPITVSRFRNTGKRIIITDDNWLDRWEGTDEFALAVEPRLMFETDAAWLSRWQEVDLLDRPHHKLVIQDSVYPITLYVDAETGRINKLKTMERDYVFGDVELEVTYHDWEMSGDVSFPTHIKVSLAGAPSMEVRRRSIETNPKSDNKRFATPDDVTYVHDEFKADRGKRLSQTIQSYSYAAAARARGVGRPEIAARDVGEGVYLMLPTPSDFTFTLVIEQENGVVIVEPGMDGLKGEAILDWLAEHLPGKPVTHAIVSHSHADHAVGVRPYVAAGAALVAHVAAEDHWKAVLNRPESVLLPDALDRNPVPATVISVTADQPFVIEDDVRPVTVYPVQCRHTSDMVFAGLNNGEIMYLGDMYIGALARQVRAGTQRPPGTPPFYSAIELNAAIKTYGLEPSILVGSHDSDTVSFEQFEAYLNE